MNNDLTDITLLLDRSASMEICRDSTVAGYNTFVEAQAKLPGVATISLVQFDDRYEAIYNGLECKSVKALGHDDFKPRGNTALLDAIGRAINDVGTRLSAMREPDRPGKVVIVIITDGAENASKHFARETIAAMVTHQREVYGWEFVFLGANQDALFTGASIGVPSHASLSYAADAKGTQDVFGSTSGYVSDVRLRGVGSFEVGDRTRQQRS